MLYGVLPETWKLVGRLYPALCTYSKRDTDGTCSQLAEYDVGEEVVSSGRHCDGAQVLFFVHHFSSLTDLQSSLALLSYVDLNVLHPIQSVDSRKQTSTV